MGGVQGVGTGNATVSYAPKVEAALRTDRPTAQEQAQTQRSERMKGPRDTAVPPPAPRTDATVGTLFSTLA